ncbi:MAG: arylesterase [Acidiferrobacterales bacterium]|nr:arylesterase [Acidiferrobacterales bacterium]
MNNTFFGSFPGLAAVIFVVAGLLPAETDAASPESIRIVAIGDSLIAGYGLASEHGFTSKLQNTLKERGCPVSIVNSGVSGDTTGGGLARVDWVLSDPYSGVIVFLGYNDAFRAVPVESVRHNLTEIIRKIQSRGLPILFFGAKAPRNLGADYYERFDSIYPDLAEEFGLLFYPFFLDGVATEPSLNQNDGIHPNEAGVDLIVGRIAPYVGQLIQQIASSQTSDELPQLSNCSI